MSSGILTSSSGRCWKPITCLRRWKPSVSFSGRKLPPRHARDEFNCEGLKWDWEVTHDGRKAYGALLHMKDQVHNNASYANEIWQYYEFTRDLAVLREFYPILEGIARYFLCDVVEKTGQGYSTRPVVGVHESPIRVRNDGITLAGTIVLLQHTVQAALLLGINSDFVQECRKALVGLMQPLRDLYNGRYFTASADSPALNMSSLGPLYPMRVLSFTDPWALSTVQAYREHCHGRMVGHGGDQNGFPWSAGVLATVCARQRLGDQAWEIIQGTEPAICSFGGMTEVMEAGEWNMQYFGTAQGAVCTALHNLLLQSDTDEIRVFPALPSGWSESAFERLLANGCEVSASVRRSSGVIEGYLLNVTAEPLDLWLSIGQQSEAVKLDSGETYHFKSTL
jgi:alpha-L-fucosidase 2